MNHDAVTNHMPDDAERASNASAHDHTATSAAPSLWRTPHYGLWFVADTTDVFADAVATFAIPLIAFAISRSEFVSGALSTVAMITVMVLLPLGGVIADRHSRRTIMVAQGLGQAVVGVVLAVCIATGTLTIPILAVAVFALGCISGLLGSATDAILRSLIPTELFARAQAVREGREAGVGLLSSPISGFLYGVFPWLPFAAGALMSGIGACCSRLLPANTIVADAPDLDNAESADTSSDPAAESSNPVTPGDSRTSFLADFIEGWRWVFTRRTLPWLVLAGALMNVAFAGMETAVQLHLIARGESAVMIGLIFTGMGVCSMIGSLIAGRVVDLLPTGRLLMLCTAFILLCFVPMILSDDYWVLFACMSAMGLALPSLNAGEFGFIYGRTPDEMQGRVASVVETSLGVLGALAPMLAGVLLQFVRNGFAVLAAAAVAMLAVGLLVTCCTRVRAIPATSQWEHYDL